MYIYMKYYCVCCNFESNLKGDYSRHLKTKKHLESTKSQQKVNIESTKSQHKTQSLGATHDCKYCMKKFTRLNKSLTTQNF